MFVNTRDVDSDLNGDMTMTIQGVAKAEMDTLQTTTWSEDPTKVSHKESAYECKMSVVIEKGVAISVTDLEDAPCNDDRIQVPKERIELTEKSWKLRT